VPRKIWQPWFRWRSIIAYTYLKQQEQLTRSAKWGIRTNYEILVARRGQEFNCSCKRALGKARSDWVVRLFFLIHPF
jgi:hypothetical protein